MIISFPMDKRRLFGRPVNLEIGDRMFGKSKNEGRYNDPSYKFAGNGPFQQRNRDFDRGNFRDRGFGGGFRNRSPPRFNNSRDNEFNRMRNDFNDRSVGSDGKPVHSYSSKGGAGGDIGRNFNGYRDNYNRDGYGRNWLYF